MLTTLRRSFSVLSQLLPPLTVFYFTKHDPSSKKFLAATIAIRERFQTLGTTFIKLGQMSDRSC